MPQHRIARAMRGAVRTGRGRVVGLIVLLLCTQTAHAGGVGEGLAGQMAKAGATERIPVIVSLPEIPLPPTVADAAGPGRHKAIAKAQQANARAAQAPLMADLRVKAALGEVADVLPLWLANAVAMKATPAAIAQLAASHPDAVIVEDLPLRLPEDPAITPLGQFGYTTGADAWNLDAVEARDVWADGYTGQGVVVAVMDTGADVLHAALAGSAFEGGADGWCDVVTSTGGASNTCPGSAVPTELQSTTAASHGTRVGSLLFGGDLSGSPDVPLGVAPDARWIGVRIFDNNGNANMSHAIAGLEWLAGLTTPPDIINMSWEVVSADVGTNCGASLANTAPLLAAIQSLRNTYGVFLVASSGNDALPHLPAAYKEVFAVGATNYLNARWADSGKGESNCTGRAPVPASGFVDTALTYRPYPNVVAPGEGVVAAEYSGGAAEYAGAVTGTSFSAPHAAGVAALLLSAYPDMPVLDLEKTLSFAAAAATGQTAIDNAHGFGLLKAKQALDSVAVNDAGIPPADEHFQLPRPPAARLTASGNNVTIHWTAPPLPAGVTATYTITKGGATVASGVSGTSHTHTGGATGGIGTYQVVAHDAAATIPDSDPTTAMLGNVNRKAGITADRVDGFDLMSLASAVGASSTDTTFDLNGDGNVTDADLTILKQHMGHKVTP